MALQSLVEQYALPPDQIEPLSRARLSAELAIPAGASPDEAELLSRIAYATGDPAIAAAVRIHADAVTAGVQALRGGRPIVTDVKMVRAGIDRRNAARLGCEIACAVDDPNVALRAVAEGIPRSVVAMRLLATHIDGAVVAIGNAPTALLAVLDMIDAGQIRPAVIVGAPVGYVAAAESKAELLLRSVPYVTVEGTRGGTPVAVSVVNTMLRRAVQGLPRKERTAVLFIAHGSRRREASQAMEAIIEGVRRRGGFDIAEHGSLSFGPITIEDGVSRCVEQGATRILAIPYFLHVGVHMVRDLPRVLREQQAKYPGVNIVLGRHIGRHLDLVDVMLDRIAQSGSLPSVDDAQFTTSYFHGEAPPWRTEGSGSGEAE